MTGSPLRFSLPGDRRTVSGKETVMGNAEAARQSPTAPAPESGTPASSSVRDRCPSCLSPPVGGSLSLLPGLSQSVIFESWEEELATPW